MKCFFVSDLHIDFYAPLTRTVSLLHRYFQEFFDRNFLPADVCCIAGDIANNYFTYVEFLKFIATKYSRVFVCLGNHDVICEREGVFGSDRDFPTSESKITFYLEEAAKIPNLHLLENLTVDVFAGCMGMCDFTYKHVPDASVEEYKMIWSTRWFDGRHWNYKGNDTEALWNHYAGIMDSLTAARPKVMMSHFLPMEFGMAEMYLKDPLSTYFYFQGEKFLSNLDDGSIWQAGHTHSAIKKVVRDSLGTKYLFIDEIQNVKGFEEVLNAYREDEEYSIFITGSNSYLLSGELVTKLTGRYLEFEMFPLTFEEYLEMKAFKKLPISPDVTEELDRYIMEGGFPKTLDYPNTEDKRRYVQGVIAEILEKDIKKRTKLRTVSVFNTIQTYIINNFGSTTSLTNILNDLRKAGSNITRETLNRYIQILLDAKILYKCSRFDLKSRKSIAGEQKYYLSDLGFYFATNTDNRINYGPVLENIIYLYARSKDYSVSVGRIGKLECDFIMRNQESQYSYVQVAMTIMSSLDTENREYKPLESIRDNYPKYVMTRNDIIQKRNGIIHANIGGFIKEHKMFI